MLSILLCTVLLQAQPPAQPPIVTGEAARKAHERFHAEVDAATAKIDARDKAERDFKRMMAKPEFQKLNAELDAQIAQAQPPAVASSPTPRPQPHPGNWHQWHGRPIVEFRRAFPNVVVVENPVGQVYAEVVNGVVVQTYTLQPVVAAAVVPAPVVVERRPWWRFGWRR